MEEPDKRLKMPAHSSKEYNAEYRKKNAKRIYEYNKAYRAQRPEWKREISRAWQLNNIEKGRIANRKHYEKNAEKRREAARKYWKNNLAVVLASNARYRAKKSHAIPKWSNKEKCREFYRIAAKLTLETGIRHQVDHIVPIRSKIVCGLHVENNLQVMTRTENIKKGNRYWPGMPSMDGGAR